MANRSSVAHLSRYFRDIGSGRGKTYSCMYCDAGVTGSCRALHLWTKHRKIFSSLEKKGSR
jgi:hypothetical protein